jgi:hypothetical protein
MKANQFAPVANLETYRKLSFTALGEYQLLIATEVVKDPKGWGDFWAYQAITNQFIIMDNGLIEAGESADPGIIKAACEAVKPDCVVLPDTLGNFMATLGASIEALPEYRKLELPLMGVVQGRNIQDIETLMDFYDANDVEYLSIPRVMVEFFQTRRWLIERARWHNKPIHLLGWSENVADDLACAGMDGVIGIDSAVPVWLPHYFPVTPTQKSVYGSRPPDFWERIPDEDDLDQMQTNIKWVRDWIRILAVGNG